MYKEKGTLNGERGRSGEPSMRKILRELFTGRGEKKPTIKLNHVGGGRGE